MINKTKVLTLIVFGLIFLNLSAQEGEFNNDPVAKLPDEDRTFRFGLHFSPNISWLKPNTTGYEKEGTKTGFSYGLSFEYFMSNNYLISTGISLSNTGGGLNYKGAYDNPNYFGSIPATLNESYHLKYIEIPFVLKLRTNEIGYLTYYGLFGLKTGFNYGAKANINYTSLLDLGSGITSIVTYSEKQVNISKEIALMNMYLVIGGGVEYNISGNTSLTLGITFNNGFINQLDSKVYLFDTNGNAIIDTQGNPVLSEKDASANLNYFALNIGIYF